MSFNLLAVEFVDCILDLLNIIIFLFMNPL